MKEEWILDRHNVETNDIIEGDNSIEEDTPMGYGNCFNDEANAIYVSKNTCDCFPGCTMGLMG